MDTHDMIVDLPDDFVLEFYLNIISKSQSLTDEFT